MQAIADVSRHLKAGFGILLARVLMNHCGFPLKAIGIGQRQTVLVEVALVFGGVEFVVHGIYCINTK